MQAASATCILNSSKTALSQQRLSTSLSSSSPGFDRIDYKILKALPLSLQKLLLRIMNNIFVEGTFPEPWSHSLVYLIPKPHGKGLPCSTVESKSCNSRTTWLETLLANIKSYLYGRGLEISPTKTELMIFAKQKIPNVKEFKIQIGSDIITPSNSVRFLGVILDPKLTGDLHMKSVINKARKVADVISALRGVWWGSHPQLLLNIYRAVLRGYIEYASHIFSLKSSPKFHRLEIIQNKAIRACLGYQISTPINTMFAEAKEPPLKLCLKFLAAKYLIKTMSITDHQVLESMFRLALTSREYPAGLTYCREKFPLFDLFLQLKSLRPSLHIAVAPSLFQHSYQAILFTPIFYCPEQDFIDLIDQVHRTKPIPSSVWSYYARYSIVFYTDGSKIGSANWVGAACFSPQLQRSLMFKLPARASIFIAEAWAIYNVVLLTLDLDAPKFTIVSDSKSILEALTPHQHTNVM
ncbi:uncharacterized protein LOC143908700 [Temnothorax americanus]|uniref:uncharacterized protein LOC143908700 n=1 Tax=Temnothorax americanus TaxID=1964332 RepID=UPI0040681006